MSQFMGLQVPGEKSKYNLLLCDVTVQPAGILNITTSELAGSMPHLTLQGLMSDFAFPAVTLHRCIPFVHAFYRTVFDAKGIKTDRSLTHGYT